MQALPDDGHTAPFSLKCESYAADQIKHAPAFMRPDTGCHSRTWLQHLPFSSSASPWHANSDKECAQLYFEGLCAQT